MKLHLPKQLFIAVVAAAFCSQKTLATEYSVIWNSSNEFHAATFTPETTDYTGEDAWKTFTDASNIWKQHTLKFTAGSYTGDGEVKFNTNFSNFCTTGITVDVDAKVSGIGGSGRTYYLGDSAQEGQNFTFNRGFEITPGSKIILNGGQTWTINNSATVKLDAGTVQNEGSTILSGGCLTLTGALTNSGNLTVNNELTISKTITNNGNVTVGTGGKVTIASLDGFDVSHTEVDYSRENGIQVISSNYTIEKGTGTSNLSSVWYGGEEKSLTDGILTFSSDVYVVSTGAVTVGGSAATEGTADADSFNVSSSGTLNIAGANNNLTAGQILSTTEGAGTICLQTNVGAIDTLNDQFTGSLTVAANGDVELHVKAVNSMTGSLLVDGGTLSLDRENSSEKNTGQLTKSITVQNHGVLKVLDSDLIDSDNTTAVTITLTDSEMQLNGKRFTMGANHSVVLNNSNITTNNDVNGDNYGVLDFASAGMTLTSSGTSEVEGIIRMRGNLNVNVTDGELTVNRFTNNATESTYTLTKQGGGTLVITQTGTNTAPSPSEALYKLTVVEGGTLALDEAGTFGNGGVTVNSGAFVEFRGSQNKTISNIISGDGGVKQTGTGTTTLSGANNYTGGTTIEGGTLKVTNASALGTGAVTVGNGTDEAILDVRGSQITNAVTLKKNATLQNTGSHIYAATNQISSLTLDGDATINAASRFGLVSRIDNNYNADGTSLNLNGHTLTISGEGGFVLVDTTISNGGKISISSGSKMLLGHTQYGTSVSATGTTVELNGGTLMLEHADTSMTLAGLSGTSGTLDNLGTVNLTGKGTYSFGATVSQTTGTIDIQAGTHTYTGSSIANTVKISAAGAKLILDSASSQTIDGAISGAGTLQKDGAGTATVARVEHMSGGLTVNGGTLNVTALSDMSGDITVNEGSLTVTTLSGACNFEKKGTGTATLTTVDNITGGFTVSAGELSIDTFNVDTTLNLTVANGATLTLDTVVVNAQNNLNLAEGITPTRKYTTDTATLAESAKGNGYLIEEATYVLFEGYAWENGTVAGYTVKATTDSNKTLLVSSGLSSHMKYYVNSYTEDYSGDSVIASDATKGIVLKEGTTLNMSTSLNANATAIEVDGASDDENASNSATIKLAADTVTLSKNQLSINSGTVTLTGSGVYDLGMVTYLGTSGNSFTDYMGAVAVGSDWTGTIKLSGTAEGVTLTHKGSASSWLQLDGLTGWFAYGVSHTANLNLTGNGLVVDDNSTKSYFHTGAIKGEGNYTIQTLSENTPTYEFTGDLSEWAGAFVVKQHATDTDKPNVTLNLPNGGTLYSGAETSGIRMEREGTLTVNIGKADSAGAVGEEGATGSTIMRGAISNTSSGTLNLNVKGSTAFAQDVTVTSMTVDAGKTATVNATLSAGTVNLGSNATVTVGAGENRKVSLQNDALVITATDSTKAATMTRNADTQGALARLQEDASFTIEDMTLMNTTITAASVDTQVNLKNVGGNATLKTGTFALQVSANAPGNVGMLSYAVTGTPSLTLASANAGDTKLVIAADPTADVSGAYGTYTLTFSLNLNLDSSISSPTTVYDWMDLVGFEGWLGTMLTNQEATYTYLPADEVEVAQVDAGTSTPTVSYSYTEGSGGNVGTLAIVITGLNVPEPTTSTLSLLALAALAARRRRK